MNKQHTCSPCLTVPRKALLRLKVVSKFDKLYSPVIIESWPGSD